VEPHDVNKGATTAEARASCSGNRQRGSSEVENAAFPRLRATFAFLGAFLDTGAVGLGLVICWMIAIARRVYLNTKARVPGSAGLAALAVALLVQQLANPCVAVEWNDVSDVMVLFLGLLLFSSMQSSHGVAAFGWSGTSGERRSA